MRRHLKYTALLLAAAVLLWWFGRGLDWPEVRYAFGRADWRLLLLATLTSCAVYPLMACRWRALLAPLVPASAREVFVATTVGFGAVFVAGRAGEFVRPIVLTLRDRRVRPSASFATIMVERVCDLTAVVVLFSFNLLWMHAPAGRQAEFAYVRAAGLTLLVAAIAGLAGLFWFKRRAADLDRSLGRFFLRRRWLPAYVGRVVRRLFEQLANALDVFVNTREFFVVSGWTLALWLANTLATLLVVRAFDLPFGWRETVFVLGWMLVGSVVPTPGGAAGAYHAATAAGLVFLGAARERAAAVAITLHLIAYLPALAFAIYFLLRGDVTLARLRHLAPGGGDREDEAGAPSRA